jgi:hypothetical protein
MKVPKREVLAVLARVGRNDLIEQAKRDLPDPVDTERDIDQARLLQDGITRGQLIDRVGGSPLIADDPPNLAYRQVVDALLRADVSARQSREQCDDSSSKQVSHFAPTFCSHISHTFANSRRTNGRRHYAGHRCL